MARTLLTNLLLLAVTAARAAAVPSTQLTAIVTQLDGAVQLTGPGVGGPPLASPWQVLHAGVTVRLPQGATAGIVCSSRSFVRLQGPASWTLTEPACAAGRQLTAGEVALVTPRTGRFKVLSGLLVLERDIRAADEDDPLAPLVLAPRNTALRTPRPAVSWLAVPTAAEYRIEWSGQGFATDIHLAAGGAGCAAGPDGVSICTLPWPADRTGLVPDRTYFLSVAARANAVAPWHSADSVLVRTPKVADVLELETRLHHLTGLGISGPALAAAIAGLYAQGDLYSDAADLYRQALAAAPSAELRVTLADLDLTMGLLSLAEPRYREALVDAAPAVRAAATFGLGRIQYARARYREAASEFRRAHELYAALDLSDEATAAAAAAEKAALRSPP